MVRNRNKWLVFSALLAIIFLAACNEQADVTVEEHETPVAVAEAYTGSLTGSNLLTGVTKASSDVQVIPKSVGELKEVRVSVGDTVQAGQILGTIDSSDLQLAVKADEKMLEQARNGLTRAKNGKTQVEINVENAKIAQQQVERQIEEAEKNLERMEILFEEGLISEKELEDVKLGLFNLEKQLEQAKLNVQVAESNMRDLDSNIKDAEIGVEQASIALQSSKKRLEDTLIKAPVSGVIASIEADIGEMVSNQAPFARIVSVDTIEVDVKVTAEQLMLFERGDEVKVEVTSLTDEFTGSVTDIAPAADMSGLFTVTVQIANSNKKIKPGMIATIIVEEVLTDESVIVPTAAVLERLDSTYVFVVQDGIAIQKEVEVIRYDTEYTAITGDIQPGDMVVTKGQTLIEHESKVRIVEEES